jgi:phosphate transport system substrate-binding protein
MVIRRFLLVGAALAALAVLADAASGITKLSGAGSTLAAPLIDAWIAARRSADPAVTVRYSPIGSGKGIHSFMTGAVDFGATERPLTDKEVALAGGALHVAATAGMVAVAYNLPGFNGDLRLGRRTLADIFGGRILYWDDPRILADNPGAGLPHRTIAIVTRRDPSGTTFAFTNHMAAIDQAWADAGPGVGDVADWPNSAMTAHGNEGVASRIAISEFSVGYVDYGLARGLGLRTASLQNRAGEFVAPSPASGALALAAAVDAMPADGRQTIPDPGGAGAYPVVTYTWLLLRRSYPNPATASALRDFVDYAIGPGQNIGAELGYVPLPGPVAERARAVLALVR